MKTPVPIEMRAGTLIDYHLRVRGIPFRWQTRITVWNPPCQFVDEQLRGPYRLWHHAHSFKEVHGGTMMNDHVTYAPLGGVLTNWLFVRRDVETIFTYRARHISACLA